MVCFRPGGGRATAQRGPRRKGRTWQSLCSGPGLSFPSYSYVFRITDTGDRLVAGLVSQTEQQEQMHRSRMFSAGPVSTCVASLSHWTWGAEPVLFTSVPLMSNRQSLAHHKHSINICE